MSQENSSTHKSKDYQEHDPVFIQIVMLAQNIDVKISHLKEVYLKYQIKGNIKY